MKIGHPADKPVAVPSKETHATQPAASAAAGASAIPATADASAKIELSSGAEALIASDSSPEFDADKVARISAAIDNGTFKINPHAIADKLISNAHEALAKVLS